MLWLTLRLLRSGNAQARKAAVEKLRSSLQPGAVNAILEAADDKNPEVRKTAIEALGEFRDDPSLTALIRALADPNPDVRGAAVDALRKRGDPKSKEPLQRVVLDADNSVRWRAAIALRALGWDNRSNELGPTFLVALGRLREAAKFGPAAVDPLLRLLAEGAYHKRITAIELLGELRDPRAVKPLVDVLADGDPLIRRAAAAALCKFCDARSIEPLIRALQDNDPNVRVAAVGALADAGNPRAVDSLLRLVNDDHWEVRVAVAGALTRIADDRSVAALIQMLQDPDKEVREKAADGIAETGAASGYEAMLVALVDEAGNVRQAAARGLRKLDPAWERSTAARRLIPRFQEALHHDDYSVEFAAMEVLRALGVPLYGQTDALTSGTISLNSPQLANRALVALLADPEPVLRQAAVEALQRSSDWRVIAHLSACLGDPSRWVRQAAAQSLATLNWQPTEPTDVARLEAARENWEALLALGPQATPTLIATLQSTSPTLRRASIEALAQLADPEAVPALLRETSHPDAAIAALLAIEVILTRQITRVGTGELAVIATLPDPTPPSDSFPIDCSALRQKAQEELERRNPDLAHPRSTLA